MTAFHDNFHKGLDEDAGLAHAEICAWWEKVHSHTGMRPGVEVEKYVFSYREYIRGGNRFILIQRYVWDEILKDSLL